MSSSCTNPQYALIRENLTKNDVYEDKYNWMTFKIDQDATEDSDMSCGFAAWDAETNNGHMYGAGYSRKAEKLDWNDATNGISNINREGNVSVDGFGTDALTKSLYFYSGGTEDWDHRVTLTGTKSGSTILDFGPDSGGGSGLAIPQASSKAWNANYEGTYFMMVYEYASYQDNGPSDNGTSVKPMKCVLESGGVLKVYDNTGDTSKPEHIVFQATLVPLADLDSSQSPGGTIAISDQFGFSSMLYDNSPDDPDLDNANQCFGAFIGQVDTSESFDVIMVMFDSDGRFGGFTMFTDVKSSYDYAYRFGFTIKDDNYSNTGL